MNLLTNKKGDERLLSIYLFLIYIIVAIGIVSGVLLFYGSKWDVRMIESGILNNKVADCLIDNGVLNKEVLNETFNLINFCNFDFVVDGEGEYAVKIILYDFDSLEKIKEISVGPRDFLISCKLEGKKFPKCEERKIYAFNNDKGVLIEIISAIGKINKNA